MGASYPTAWLVRQKLNLAMARPDSSHQLSGVVQLDDAYLGGEGARGNAGRASENKVPFVADVSVDYRGHPWYLDHGFQRQSGLLRHGHRCRPCAPDGNGPRTETARPGAVNTVRGKLKTTLAGAFHTLNYSKYAARLAAFSHRFHCRFDLRWLVARFIVDVARCKPIKEEDIRAHAYARF